MKPAKTAPITTSKPKPPAFPVGWVCPKCGAVMAPHVQTCVNCTRPDPTIICGQPPVELMRY